MSHSVVFFDGRNGRTGVILLGALLGESLVCTFVDRRTMAASMSFLSLFSEHVGEMRIIVLIEEGWSHIKRPPHTPKLEGE
jgi:hypothetical protein